jgi:hypothetical protein
VNSRTGLDAVGETQISAPAKNGTPAIQLVAKFRTDWTILALHFLLLETIICLNYGDMTGEIYFTDLLKHTK